MSKQHITLTPEILITTYPSLSNEDAAKLSEFLFDFEIISHDNGFSSGEDAGYKSGYNYGFADGYDECEFDFRVLYGYAWD
jgi:hypothetical protein